MWIQSGTNKTTDSGVSTRTLYWVVYTPYNEFCFLRCDLRKKVFCLDHAFDLEAFSVIICLVLSGHPEFDDLDLDFRKWK